MTELQIQKRDVSVRPKKVRQEGLMPAVCYGRVEKSRSISVPLNQFEKVWKEAGESTIITLKGDEKDMDVLIVDVDLDPVTSVPRHADFYIFEEGRSIEVEVPLEYVGVAPAVKEKGGVLVKVLHEIKIAADPRKLPHSIEVDVTPLSEIDSHLAIKDLTLPEGVTAVDDVEDIVASIYEPQEEPEEPAEEMDLSEIEVEKKGKDEESDASGDGEEGESGEEEK